MKRNTIKLLKEDKSIRETQAKEASHRVHQRMYTPTERKTHGVSAH